MRELKFAIDNSRFGRFLAAELKLRHIKVADFMGECRFSHTTFMYIKKGQVTIV